MRRGGPSGKSPPPVAEGQRQDHGFVHGFGLSKAVPCIWSMMDETANLILEHLRTLRSGVEALREDMREVKIRLTHVEEGLAGVNRRIDRVESRLDRIETRLGLIDAPI